MLTKGQDIPVPAVSTPGAAPDGAPAAGLRQGLAVEAREDPGQDNASEVFGGLRVSIKDTHYAQRGTESP